MRSLVLGRGSHPCLRGPAPSATGRGPRRGCAAVREPDRRVPVAAHRRYGTAARHPRPRIRRQAIRSPVTSTIQTPCHSATWRGRARAAGRSPQQPGRPRRARSSRWSHSSWPCSRSGRPSPGSWHWPDRARHHRTGVDRPSARPRDRRPRARRRGVDRRDRRVDDLVRRIRPRPCRRPPRSPTSPRSCRQAARATAPASPPASTPSSTASPAAALPRSPTRDRERQQRQRPRRAGDVAAQPHQQLTVTGGGGQQLLIAAIALKGKARLGCSIEVDGKRVASNESGSSSGVELVTCEARLGERRTARAPRADRAGRTPSSCRSWSARTASAPLPRRSRTCRGRSR